MSLHSALQPVRLLGHPIRWRIVERLLLRPLCVSDLARILQLPESSISSQLQTMARAGGVIAQRSGRSICYRVSDRFALLTAALRQQLHISEQTDSALIADAWNAGQVGA